MSDDKPAQTKTPSPSFQLTPSQALKPGKGQGGGGNNNNNGTRNSNNAKNSKNNGKGNNRRRRNGKNSNNNKKPQDRDGNNTATNATSNADQAEEKDAKNQTGNNGRRQRQRQRKNQQGNTDEDNGKRGGNGGTNAKGGEGNSNATKPKNRRRKPKKKYPWRRHIPDGTVDPITLDNLDTLEYPPFALCADEPYVPVPEWPVPLETPGRNSGSNNKGNDGGGNVEDLNRQRLADQWGEHLLPSKENNARTAAEDGKPKASAVTPSLPLSQRPLNLFDGRALAFYMVSQLQFIDPFTRRDLTRAELQNLDRYLDRYGNVTSDFDTNGKNNQNKRNAKNKKQKLRVTDAYDAKGITLSSAGAAAATAQGRADIMQQTAQQLLNSLFVGQSSVSSLNHGESGGGNQRDRQSQRQTPLQEQYAAMQRQEREAAEAGERRYERGFGNDDINFFSSNDEEAGGFLVIDDDENPEMRGRNQSDFPSLTATAPNPNELPSLGSGTYGGSSPFYSAAHITGRHGGGRLASEPGAFPALPPSAAETSSGSATSRAKKSKTLSKISGVVKKTTEAEKQKQWEAREAARRKAMMSNLTFGMNPLAMEPSRSLLKPPPSNNGWANGYTTEEQMERNRAFAEALGVKPATQRHYSSGWARPTTTDGDGKSGNIESLNELEAVLYPETLVVTAREFRMNLLLKLEKKWKRFLNDDKAASLPLNRMDRSARAFVHQYAEFWNLKTESFDPEPDRYIHCVKLPNTRMPQPLLSDVARNWGPSLPMPDATRTIASVMNDHTSQQTAGQISRSPFKAPQSSGQSSVAKLRSATAMSSSKGDLVALGEAAVQNSRSDVLMDKERPQLKLLPRSVPRELPPFEEQLQQEAMAALDLDEDVRRRQLRLEEKRRREREIEQKKRQILEDAFASDNESDSKPAATADSDSEWGDAQDALYVESDEE